MFKLAFFLGTSVAYLLTIWNVVPFIVALAVPRARYSFSFAIAFGVAMAAFNYGGMLRMSEILTIEAIPMGTYVGLTVWGALLAAFVGFAIGWLGRKMRGK